MRAIYKIKYINVLGRTGPKEFVIGLIVPILKTRKTNDKLLVRNCKLCT